MRNLAIVAGVAAAELLAGVVAWRAEAMPPSGAKLPALAARQSLPAEKAACGGPDKHCRTGHYRICIPAGRCWCKRC
jgi:hypothetical protein